MHKLGICLGAGLAMLAAQPVFAQSAVYVQTNVLNVAEIDQSALANGVILRQTGVTNHARIRQIGKTNRAELYQQGTTNAAAIGQMGESNVVQIQQTEAAGYGSPSGGRISRSTVGDAGSPTYLTVYQNGPVSLLQAAPYLQASGRLGRR